MAKKQTAQPDQLLIGVAATDITPPIGVKLSGYGPRKGLSDGLAHRLRAEAVVCRSCSARTRKSAAAASPKAWALVTTDTVGIPGLMVDAIRRKIARRIPIAHEAIMICAAHTHSGPAGMKTYDSDLSDLDLQYGQDLQDLLADVVVKAWRGAKAGAFEAAWTEAPELGSNRRVVGDNGQVENVWIDAEGKHTGYFDPSIMLLGVRRPSGRLKALLVNYGVHPVVLGPGSLKISADYVGYMKDYLEAHGITATSMFALAGAANINPRWCIQVGSQHPRRMGERLGEIVRQAAAKLRPISGGPLAVSRQAWQVNSLRDWPAGSRKQADGKVETEIVALRAGDLAIIGIPGELFSEYTAQLREMSPLPETLVISLANDSVGYLPTDEAIPQGGHEVRFSVGPIEQSLKETARKCLHAVATPL